MSTRLLMLLALTVSGTVVFLNQNMVQADQEEAILESINFKQSAPFQEEEKPPISFEDFVDVSKAAQKHREDRLVSIDKFLAMSHEENTIILDTRSQAAYDMKHLKGAVHLDFSDFTEEKLAKVIPNKETRILIYCNNNFKDDPILFASKTALPSKITLALNIPTFINLYGYGYENLYELNSYLSVKDERLKFEGTRVLRLERQVQ